MGKLLFWAVVILVALLAARLLAAHNRKNNTPPTAPHTGRGGSAAVKGNDGNAEAMVRCAHCGIHMPRSEAVLSDGKTWCSPEHARLGVRQ
ncbi:MAG: PP0621 family protein [Pusillimonas sp.]